VEGPCTVKGDLTKRAQTFNYKLRIRGQCLYVRRHLCLLVAWLDRFFAINTNSTRFICSPTQSKTNILITTCLWTNRIPRSHLNVDRNDISDQDLRPRRRIYYKITSAPLRTLQNEKMKEKKTLLLPGECNGAQFECCPRRDDNASCFFSSPIIM